MMESTAISMPTVSLHYAYLN